MKREVTVQNNGAVLNIDGIDFEYYDAKFGDITLPSSYVALMLDPETERDAACFLAEMQKTVITAEGRNLVLEKAGENGLRAGRETLAQMRADTPKGNVRVFRSLTGESYRREKKVVITDGKKAFSFETHCDIDGLPPNVYCSEVHVYFQMTGEHLAQLRNNASELFAIVARAVEAREQSCVNDDALLNAFFANREISYRLLEEEENLGKIEKNALECPQGYLLYKETARGWIRCYLITREGDAYLFSRRNEDDLKEAVSSALKLENPIPNLRRTELTQEELKEVAKRLSPLNAALSLALLP